MEEANGSMLQGAVQGGEAAAGQALPPYLHQLSEVAAAMAAGD
ncbi:hypothetical protein HaLaN_13912 [Haematococcus lacustris]|uniref:Uncharacterized protein n=1 Tax=Haematococcus lacustris TaxID=44745 RepID=A0A699Z6V6_HAELA|nr:hypothetical protein HaLaN_13912 [Haematococcus lacustris]